MTTINKNDGAVQKEFYGEEPTHTKTVPITENNKTERKEASINAGKVKIDIITNAGSVNSTTDTVPLGGRLEVKR